MPLNLRQRFGDVTRCGATDATESPNITRFFHPSYGKIPISPNTLPPIRDALISLPAFDDGGIHYDTAHTTCGVLAGNRWDGYFSLDRDGTTRVQLPPDGILRERAYFFCLPPSSASSTSTDPDPYPIVAGFRDWRFPHHNLPPCWERVRTQFHGGSQAAARRCIFTDCGLSLDAAHLVPVKQSEWYDDNGMGDYGKASSFSTDAVNVSTNIIPLRTDVHRMFDERNFCFVPKADSTIRESMTIQTRKHDEENAHGDDTSNRDLSTYQAQGQEHIQDDETRRAANTISPATSNKQPNTLIVGHVFNSIPGGELQKLWHNREVYPGICAASLECLFARFAWTVFSPNVFRDFLFMTKEPRSLLVWDEDSGRYRTETREPAKCKLTLRAARTRSESPTKRQRQAGEDGQNKDEWESLLQSPDHYSDESSDLDSGYNDASHEENMESFESTEFQAEDEENPRGRSRKRKHVETDWGALDVNYTYPEAKRVNDRCSLPS